MKIPENISISYENIGEVARILQKLAYDPDKKLKNFKIDLRFDKFHTIGHFRVYYKNKGDIWWSNPVGNRALIKISEEGKVEGIQGIF